MLVDAGGTHCYRSLDVATNVQIGANAQGGAPCSLTVGGGYNPGKTDLWGPVNARNDFTVGGNTTLVNVNASGSVRAHTSYFGTGKSTVQIGQGYKVDGACVYAFDNDLLIGSSTSKVIVNGDLTVTGTINGLIRYTENAVKFHAPGGAYYSKFLVPNKMALYYVYMSRTNSTSQGWAYATLNVYPCTSCVSGAYNYGFTNYNSAWGPSQGNFGICGYGASGFTDFNPNPTGPANICPGRVLVFQGVDGTFTYELVIQQIC